MMSNVKSGKGNEANGIQQTSNGSNEAYATQDGLTHKFAWIFSRKFFNLQTVSWPLLF